jgi:hypothetical protein
MIRAHRTDWGSQMVFRGILCALLLSATGGAFATPANSFFSLPVLQTNAPNSNIPNVANDIDGDGVSDLLWFNPITSQFGYWLLSLDQNGNFSRKGSRIFGVTPGYVIGATGDFNGDGMTDLMWTSANRDLYLWTNNHGAFSSTYVGTYPEGWTLLGAADVDGDGQADLLWWNEGTSQFGYWIMKNGKQTSAKIIAITAGYHVAAIGYFNASNRVSILWHGPNGELYVWDSQGTSFTSFNLGTLTGDSAQSRIDGFNPYTVANRAGFCFLTVDTTPVNQYCWAREFNAAGTQTSAEFGPNGGTSLPLGVSIGASVTSIGMVSQQFVYNVLNSSQQNPAMIYIPGTAQLTGPLSADSYSSSYPLGWYLVGSRSNLNP